jgi:predicted amino acid-binding ACT domain protein
MTATDMSGTILIREKTLLPAGLAIESEVFLPGWRVVKNLDGSALARNIERANWNFFYLVGETRATVLGRDRSGTLRRALKRVLAKQEKQFNSLEITKVVWKRFLGIPFMLSVAAHSRHIQQSICLVPAKDFVLAMPVPAPENRLSSSEQRRAEVITKPHEALISNS